MIGFEYVCRGPPTQADEDNVELPGTAEKTPLSPEVPFEHGNTSPELEAEKNGGEHNCSSSTISSCCTPTASEYSSYTEELEDSTYSKTSSMPSHCQSRHDEPLNGPQSASKATQHEITCVTEWLSGVSIEQDDKATFWHARPPISLPPDIRSASEASLPTTNRKHSRKKRPADGAGPSTTIHKRRRKADLHSSAVSLIACPFAKNDPLNHPACWKFAADDSHHFK